MQNQTKWIKNICEEKENYVEKFQPIAVSVPVNVCVQTFQNSND